jgi:2-polyprenyl-3-methyl-5-hydroxy-6-metoxy-1,4-benzoquinol methylase
MTNDLMRNPIIRDLQALDLAQPQNFTPISARVRDRDDVFALRCSRSGIIVLNRTDHINDAVYAGRDDLSYWGEGEREKLLQSTAADDQRRAAFVRRHADGKQYLDIGTGLGGILDLVRTSCAGVHAVELQAGPRADLRKRGYAVYADISAAPARHFDVVSLFHVYEHIPDQIEFLTSAKRLLKPGGLLIVEVPHARDALITLYDSTAFLNFTLWSQHLILHTRDSLHRFMTASAFTDVRIEGIQRYPLSNHLYWLAKAKPGGHQVWDFLNDAALNAAYESRLAQRDLTDTLFATATA